MSPEANPAELWRLLGVLATATLLFCAFYLHQGYRSQVPAILWRVGIAYGLVLAVVAVGLVANWLSPYPPTPGAKIYTLVSVPAAVYVAWATLRVARHRD